MNNKFKKLIKILKFKKFMIPPLIMFGFLFLLIGIVSLLENVRSFDDLLRFLLAFSLMITGTLIFLKFFELIASLMGASKIYDKKFGKEDENSNNNKE